MDNRSGEDGPFYVPARHHMEWWQVLILIFVAFFVFWLLRLLIVGYAVDHFMHQVHHSFGVPAAVAAHPVVIPPRAPVLVGPYRLPLSTTYRLQGKVRSVGHVDYLATAGPGTYVMIPSTDCRLVNGGPYCKYHGTTVTLASGVQ